MTLFEIFIFMEKKKKDWKEITKMLSLVTLDGEIMGNEIFLLVYQSSSREAETVYIKEIWYKELNCCMAGRRRKWQPTPVFLLGESQGWGSLVGCHLWGHTESDTTEAT